MRTTKIVAGLLCVVLLLSGVPVVLAAPKTKKIAPQLPLEIVADEMYFSDKTGELFARGNVVITQNQSQILADVVRGNDKETEVWVDGKVQLIEPLVNITGMRVRYNYGNQFGTMQDIQGKCGTDYVSASKIHFENGKYTAYDATTTGCPARTTPDYRITARKIEIWPNDKMIAYDARVWIKNFVIYSTPRYMRSLKKTDKESEFPSFGYLDSDGFWLKQRVSYALSEKAMTYVDLIYYTRTGFRPNFGLVDQEKDYTLRLVAGRFLDGNNNWVNKEPEFRFELNPRRLGKLPISYKVNATFGSWQDDVKTSWHQDYNLYFSHDPMYLDREKTWTLKLGTGYQHVRESFDNSSQNVFRYNVGLSKQLSPAFNVWAAYNYTNNDKSAFAYDRAEVGQEGILGLSWKIDNRTTLSYYTSYDFGKNQVYENYYGVKHSFHCWEMDITYRAVKKELVWSVAVVRL